MVSRGKDGAEDAPGDHLGIGGTHLAEGRLLFFNGNQANEALTGTTEIAPKTWNHVVLVRDGPRVTVYLNGKTEPEINGEAAITVPADSDPLFFGGRNDRFANFAGKLDEIAVYDRALTPDEIAAHQRAAGLDALDQRAASR